MKAQSSIFFDVNDHAQSLLNWSQEYDQVGGGQFEGHLYDVEFAEVRVFRERMKQSIVQHVHTPAGKIHLMVPNNIQQNQTTDQARKILSEGATLLPYDSDFHFVAPAETDYTIISISQEKLKPLLTENDYDDLLAMHRSYGLAIDLKTLADAQYKLCLLISELTSVTQADQEKTAKDQLIQRAWQDQATLIFLEMLNGNSEQHSSCPRPLGNQHNYIVQSCHDYVTTPEGSCASIVEICSTLKTPHRTLNYSFKKATGTSPIQYIRAIKMNAVKRELLKSQLPITDIAANYGFFHMGYFTKEYRRLFGETPSMTRQSAI